MDQISLSTGASSYIRYSTQEIDIAAVLLPLLERAMILTYQDDFKNQFHPQTQ
jgi:hypothetical protein